MEGLLSKHFELYFLRAYSIMNEKWLLGVLLISATFYQFMLSLVLLQMIIQRQGNLKRYEAFDPLLKYI